MTLANSASAIENLEAVEWRSPAFSDGALKAEKREIHIWRIDLSEWQPPLACDGELLSPDERERANRFVFAQDRRRYIGGRSALRMILARYLDVHPACIQFRYGSNGKPELSNFSDNQLSFNLANSRDLAVAAISIGRRIGIDLERLDSTVEVVDIAAQFFTENELASITAVPMECQYVRFFEFWTRKEAFLKALGDGLSIPLNQFDTSRWRDGVVFQAKGFKGNWFVRSFVPESGYLGALVTDAGVERIRWFNFQRRALLSSSVQPPTRSA